MILGRDHDRCIALLSDRSEDVGVGVRRCHYGARCSGKSSRVIWCVNGEEENFDS